MKSFALYILTGISQPYIGQALKLKKMKIMINVWKLCKLLLQGDLVKDKIFFPKKDNKNFTAIHIVSYLCLKYLICKWI